MCCYYDRTLKNLPSNNRNFNTCNVMLCIKEQKTEFQVKKFLCCYLALALTCIFV